MTSEEISQLIRKEIGNDWHISNAHGVDLRKCLVMPEKTIFLAGVDKEKEEELWLVLEEIPEDGSGYKIVYDEKDNMFGLATSLADSEQDYFLGLYGNFLETLEAM